MCIELKGVTIYLEVLYITISDCAILKLHNIFLTNENIPQVIKFPIAWKNLISFGKIVDMQGYIVDNIPTINEYIDKKKSGHFTIKNKK